MLSRFPLALSHKTRQTRSCTRCESTHMTLGIDTRQTHRTLTGIRTMKTTAHLTRGARAVGALADAQDGLDIAWTSIRDTDSWDEGS
jgi:alkylhydroperoxidase family enzyme